MNRLFEWVLLSERDYEYLTKGIAAGVGLGVSVGVIAEDIILFFALGGVTGIIGASVLSIIKKSKDNIDV